MSTRRRWWIVAVAAVSSMAVLAGCGSDNASAVTLEPADQPGADPWTVSVQAGPAVELAGNVQAITAAARDRLPTDVATNTHVAPGNTPGLYGGTGDAAVCNAEQLVTFLVENKDKAAAWAGVLGIAPDAIADYVGALTPVVLTTDTLVTNHGYRDGRPTTLQSVLQAGTAVMVDATGLPRVKCNCGNPLTNPEAISPAKTSGTPWPGYAPGNVAVVQPGSAVTNLTLINIATGDTFEQPAGSKTGTRGTTDGQWIAAKIANISADEASTIITSPDGRAWTKVTDIPYEVVEALAYADGRWVAVGWGHYGANYAPLPVDQSAHILTSTDLKTWTRVLTGPGMLKGVAYGDGRFTAVGNDYQGTNPVGIVYTSTDGQAWTKLDDVAGTSFSSVAFGDNTWLASSYDDNSTYTSDDGSTWSRYGTLPFAAGGRLAYGAPTWFAASGGLARSADGATWTEVPSAPPRISTVGYGVPGWLAAGGVPPFSNEDGNDVANSGFYTSADGGTWERVGDSVPDTITAIVFAPVAAP